MRRLIGVVKGKRHHNPGRRWRTTLAIPTCSGPTTPTRAGRLADASVDQTNVTSLIASHY